MDAVFTHCAGRDVHKKSVTVCRLVSDSTGQHPEGVAELRTFGTMTIDLLALADWLLEAGVTPIAMESTGEYWKPVSNLLEGVVTIFLVNASHVKNVPGRKTDPEDARWLAKLMRYGLLQASFIPPVAQRELRDLTRYRTKLVQNGPAKSIASRASWSAPTSNGLLWRLMCSGSQDVRCWRR
jgi:transposase